MVQVPVVSPVEPRETREVFFATTGERMATPIYEREKLPAAFAAEGPAIIEEFGSTTVIGPGDRLHLGDLGEMAITLTD